MAPADSAGSAYGIQLTLRVLRSSVRRILKRGGGGGGGQKLRKIWEELRSESEIVPPEISPIFSQNQVKSKKKVFNQFQSDFMHEV